MGIANRQSGSVGGDIRARFAWNKCVGSHVLLICRLRNLALATGIGAIVAFFNLGVRVAIAPIVTLFGVVG